MQFRLYTRHCRLCFALALLPAGALAQQHPADPSITTAAPRYKSAYEGYQPLRDEKGIPWREANEAVARAGGHIGILGGAAAGHSHPAPAPTQPAGARR
jgi:hypothetical protein